MDTTDTAGRSSAPPPRVPDAPVSGSAPVAVARAVPARGEHRREEVTGYERSPSDVLRTCVLALAAVPLLGVARWARGEAAALDGDLVGRLSSAAPLLERTIVVTAALLVAGAVAAAWTAPLLTRSPRLAGYLIVAGAAAVGAAHGVDVVLGGGADVPGRETELPWELDGVLGVDGLAVAAASFAVLAPFVSRRWRRAGVLLLTGTALLHLLVPPALPTDLLVALMLGTAVGSATLLLLGRPVARPTRDAVAAALAGSGLDAVAVEPAVVDARGSVPWTAVLRDGQRVFAKVMGAENRAADLLFRVYRFLRLRDVGDERPFSSLRRTVEHEALVSLFVRDTGGRTPRLRAIAPVGRDSWLLSHDLVDGTTLDRLPDAALTGPVLSGIWEQVALLRRHRVAHRDLRAANVLLDRSGTPWLIDWGFSEVAAGPELLDADVAQALVALALRAGVDPVVDTAVAALGPEAVAASLPRLQPDSLSGATRDALRHDRELAGRLRAAVARRCGVPEPGLARLERIRPRTLLVVAVLALAGYLLLPQLGDVPGMVRRVRDADWDWASVVVAASVLTYVGAALSLAGAVPARLRPVPLFAAQLASSFAGRLVPAGLGGMALNVRYLQRSGVDVAVATSGVGLSYAAGTVVHVLLLLGFAALAGRSLGSLRPAGSPALLWGALALLVLCLAAVAVPALRRRVTARLLPPLRRSAHGVAAALRSPGRLVLLVGGSAATTLGYLVCLYAATRALGGDLGLAAVGVVYLLGAAVAAAAPTPGGLGALEAALVAGLVAAGMDHTVAVPAVFLYRLATFWLPVLPGWAAFAWLRRSGRV
ncbi:undecaprenyl-diphosphatase [Geodermatophilus saharensis]|uniref:Undecaprenyl-diphosphatase n=1 Tax=Geodermatophilus saharensis TaxID=1137994 RepID=A0A239CY00_9ACTN|nr:lysylphosphatidylglycerol synthase domain-containing protein [Geodermatophilus saharensis]SNS24980.1 undecaprenyl-diphosphatase [Geodermatophilus saharensis]